MPEFVPNGYLTARDAIDRLGRKQFGSEWTSDEHNARRGLISPDEWLRRKNLAPPRGSGASGGGRFAIACAVAPPTRPDDPSDPVYQKEYRANKRYIDTCSRLRQLLESGGLEAVVLDFCTGSLHPAPVSLWRRSDAGRMVERGQAPIPNSRNSGTLLIRLFEAPDANRPMPKANIAKAIELLKGKLASGSLTRPKQAKFLRESFPNYQITDRQMNAIFQAVPAPTGRPRKSGK